MRTTGVTLVAARLLREDATVSDFGAVFFVAPAVEGRVDRRRGETIEDGEPNEEDDKRRFAA